MHAITMTQPGGPDVLTWSEVPDPEPGPGEVLVRVTASAVNRADLLQRQGNYPPPPGASDILGLECSGTVVALGDGVEGRSIGDEVCCLLAGGGYAELVAVPVGQAMPVPAGVDLVTAGGLAEVACTVWSNLVMQAGLADGETALLHGGSSGIGTMAIQVARLRGARVVVTAGSAEKLDRCRQLGAEVLVNYRTHDFVEAVAPLGGADVILDLIGAKYLARNIEALAPDGRLVVIGMQGGATAEINLGVMLPKRASVAATSLRGRPLEQKAAICAAVVSELWPAVADGRVRPVVDQVLPIADAAQAHRVLEESGHIGKVLLQVG